MKKKTWIAVLLTAALLIVALLLPAWLLRRTDARLLSQTRVTESAVGDFALENKSTLVERLQILASNQTIETWIAPEMAEQRYGTEEEILTLCRQELEAMAPDWDWSGLDRVTNVSFLYCYEQETGASAMFAVCGFDWMEHFLHVYLDLQSERVVGLQDWDGVLYDLVFTAGGWDEWSRQWGSYLGLDVAELEDGTVIPTDVVMIWDEYAVRTYTEPDDLSRRITYVLSLDGGAAFVWMPYLTGS